MILSPETLFIIILLCIVFVVWHFSNRAYFKGLAISDNERLLSYKIGYDDGCVVTLMRLHQNGKISMREIISETIEGKYGDISEEDKNKLLSIIDNFP